MKNILFKTLIMNFDAIKLCYNHILFAKINCMHIDYLKKVLLTVSTCTITQEMVTSGVLTFLWPCVFYIHIKFSLFINMYIILGAMYKMNPFQNCVR
jgi:hypothetical protein